MVNKNNTIAMLVKALQIEVFEMHTYLETFLETIRKS